MTTQVNVHEAKTHFSKLLARVAAGETIVIAKAGKPMAELTPLDDRPPNRIAGRYHGKIRMREDFDEPLPEFDEQPP